MTPGTQLSPDDITMLQAATHMPSSGHDLSSMHAAMNAQMGHHVVYSQHENWPRQSVSVDSFVDQPSFTQDDSQMMDREEHDDSGSLAAVVTAPKPNGSRTSANNELEMRQLFATNRHRTLQDVAVELHGNDRGPNSERARQVFAMLWYARTYVDWSVT